MRLARGPLAWAGAIVVLSGLAAAFDVPVPAAWLFVPAGVISYACGAARSAAGGAAGAVLLFGALLLHEHDVVPLALITAGPWVVGRAVGSRQQLVVTLERHNRELAAEHEGYARLSVQRERARIARELHDIVAHHLAVMVIQAGAGRVGVDEAHDLRLDSIRESGGHALAEMDRLVAMLQSAEPAASASDGRLRRLLDQAHATGLDLRTELLPEDADLAAEVADSAYRVVQEGLTNVMKHAPGSVVRLRLAISAGALELELVDTGGAPPAALARTGGGYGLAGMRERICALDGTFEAGPDGSGWRVFARIPAHPRPTSAG